MATAVQAMEQNHAELQAAAFQALEQKVLRAIELLRKERELRAAAEARTNQAEEHSLEVELRLEEQEKKLAEKSAELDRQNTHVAELSQETERQTAALRDHAEQIRRHEGDLSQLQSERDQVRQRVERLLQHLDEFTGA